MLPVNLSSTYCEINFRLLIGNIYILLSSINEIKKIHNKIIWAVGVTC